MFRRRSPEYVEEEIEKNGRGTFRNVPMVTIDGEGCEGSGRCSQCVEGDDKRGDDLPSRRSHRGCGAIM